MSFLNKNKVSYKYKFVCFCPINKKKKKIRTAFFTPMKDCYV